MTTEQEKIANIQIEQSTCFEQDEERKLDPSSKCPSKVSGGKCLKNASAIVPDWRKKTELEPFFNQRNCRYSITITTEFFDTGFGLQDFDPISNYYSLSNTQQFCSALENLEQDSNNILHKVFTTFEKPIVESQIQAISKDLQVSMILASRLFSQKEKAARRLLRTYGRNEDKFSVRRVIDAMTVDEWFMDSRPNSAILVLCSVHHSLFEREEIGLDPGQPKPASSKIAFGPNGFKKKTKRLSKAFDRMGNVARISKVLDKKEVFRSEDSNIKINFKNVSKFLSDLPLLTTEFLKTKQFIFERGKGKKTPLGLAIGEDGVENISEYINRVIFLFDGEDNLIDIEVKQEDCEPGEVVALGREITNLFIERTGLDNKVLAGVFRHIKDLHNAITADVFNKTPLGLIQIALPSAVERGLELNQEFTADEQETCVGSFIDDRNDLFQLDQTLLDNLASPFENVVETLMYAYNQEVCDYDLKTVEDWDLYKAAAARSLEKLLSEDQVFLDLCSAIIALTNSGEDNDLKDMTDKILDRFRICGLAKFLEEAIKCLLKASTLEEGLARAIRAGLGAMEPTIFRNFVEGLPGNKGAFIAQYVFDRVNEQLARGDIGLINISEVPQAAGENPGLFFADGGLATDDMMTEIGEGFGGMFPDQPGRKQMRNEKLDARPFINPYENSFNNPNVIQAFTTESPQPTQEQIAAQMGGEAGLLGLSQPLTADTIFKTTPTVGPDGNIGSQISINPMFGSAEGNIATFTIDAIMIAYEDDLLSLADILTNFPGSKIANVVLSYIVLLFGGNCSRAPLFSPGIYEFLKDFELQFCRNRDPIRFPTFRGLPKLPDVLGALKDAAVYVLKELFMAIISAIIELICRTIGDAICKALGAVGDLLLGSAEGNPDSLADLMAEAFCGPGDRPESFTSADFSALSKAVGGLNEEDGAALSGPVFASYMRDLSTSLTQGESYELCMGQVSDEIARLGSNLARIKYEELIPIMGSEQKFKEFFGAVSSVIPVSFKSDLADRLVSDPDNGQPAFPSVCANPDDLNAFYSNRMTLLSGRASPEEIERINSDYKDKINLNLESLTQIANMGIDDFLATQMPPLESTPGCNDGVMDAEPAYSAHTTEQATKTSLRILKDAFYEDMIGDNNGLVCLILSDTLGAPFPKHKFKQGLFDNFYLSSDKDDSQDLFDVNILSSKGRFPIKVANSLQKNFYQTNNTVLGTSDRNKIQLHFADSADGRARGYPGDVFALKYEFTYTSNSPVKKRT